MLTDGLKISMIEISWTSCLSHRWWSVAEISPDPMRFGKSQVAKSGRELRMVALLRTTKSQTGWWESDF